MARLIVEAEATGGTGASSGIAKPGNQFPLYIVASVTHANGAPRNGLSAADFRVVPIIVAPGGGEVTIARVIEPQPGAYLVEVVPIPAATWQLGRYSGNELSPRHRILPAPSTIHDLPARWFIVIPDMFSNGLSSGAADTEDYPAVVTMADNVRAQHRLLTEHLGVTKVAAAYGFSMGAGQAYHWAALFPDLVERAIVVCGSARTSLHNKVFLSGLLRTLEAAPEHLGNGRFSAEPLAAVRAFR